MFPVFRWRGSLIFDVWVVMPEGLLRTIWIDPIDPLAQAIPMTPIIPRRLSISVSRMTSLVLIILGIPQLMMMYEQSGYSGGTVLVA